MLRTMVVLITGLAAVACSEPDAVLDVTFDVCGPVSLSAPDATLTQSAAVEAAAQMWRERGFAGIGAPAADGQPTIPVVFEDAGPATYGLYDDEGGVIYVNWNLDDHAMAVTIAHELGHAFGLWHVDATARLSVMNPGNTAIEPNLEDQHALVSLWGCNL